MIETNPLRRPDRTRPEPLWHQAEQALRTMITNGTWPDGTQLPNEEKLGQMLGVSRITVRHALRNLEESGLLRREHGRGTFVRGAKVIAGIRGLTSFTQEMANLGLVGGSRMLDRREIPASEEVASALEMRAGAPVLMIRRLRLGNDDPIGVQTTYLAADRVAGLAESDAPIASLYDTLRDRFGITPKEAREIYRVGTVSPEDAALLGIPPGSPGFLVERIAYDAAGPFEFTESTMRGDRYEIRSKLYL